METTPNGMIRESKEDKPIYFHYLPPHVLERYGVHMLAGAKKHGSGNFLKGGYGKENYLDSLYRHLLALKQGETNEDHAASIMFNIIGYMHEDWQENNSRMLASFDEEPNWEKENAKINDGLTYSTYIEQWPV